MMIMALGGLTAIVTQLRRTSHNQKVQNKTWHLSLRMKDAR